MPISTISLWLTQAKNNINFSGTMHTSAKKYQARQAFSLVELVLVLVIIILITGFASLPVVRIIERSRIDADAYKLDVFLRKSVQYAVMKGKNIRVMLDIDNGVFETYEIFKPLEFSSENEDVEPVPILDERPQLGGAEFKPIETEPEDDRQTEFLFECEPMQRNFLDSILTEDDQQHSTGEFFFEAGPGGWNESFVLTITSLTGQYSNWLRCERSTATVKKYNNEAKLPKPVENF